MSLPLATLWRNSSLILLRERLLERRLEFSSVDDAEAYLRFWKPEGAAITQMRSALQRAGQPSRVSALSDQDVIRALASALVRGSLVLTESLLPPPSPDWVFPLAADAPSAAAQPPIRARQPAPTGPVPIAAVPLLPLLEEVQIEGADVLPEILQTLEQIDLTMGSIKLAAVSLQPAPSGVAPINAAMQQASASVTATLTDL
jgi:hypothetical protein